MIPNGLQCESRDLLFVGDSKRFWNSEHSPNFCSRVSQRENLPCCNFEVSNCQIWTVLVKIQITPCLAINIESNGLVLLEGERGR